MCISYSMMPFFQGLNALLFLPTFGSSFVLCFMFCLEFITVIGRRISLIQSNPSIVEAGAFLSQIKEYVMTKYDKKAPFVLFPLAS